MKTPSMLFAAVGGLSFTLAQNVHRWWLDALPPMTPTVRLVEADCPEPAPRTEGADVDAWRAVTHALLREARLPPGETIAAVTPTVFLVSRDAVSALLDNASPSVARVRVVPYQEAGKTVGYRLSGMPQGSPLQKLGIQNGDVIAQLNGAPLTSVEACMAQYRALRAVDIVEVSIRRRGERRVLIWRVV